MIRTKAQRLARTIGYAKTKSLGRAYPLTLEQILWRYRVSRLEGRYNVVDYWRRRVVEELDGSGLRMATTPTG